MNDSFFGLKIVSSSKQQNQIDLKNTFDGLVPRFVETLVIPQQNSQLFFHVQYMQQIVVL